MLPYLEGWLGVGYEWDEELLQEWSVSVLASRQHWHGCCMTAYEQN